MATTAVISFELTAEIWVKSDANTVVNVLSELFREEPDPSKWVGLALTLPLCSLITSEEEESTCYETADLIFTVGTDGTITEQ